MTHAKHAASRGFTLIEIAVAVGIIAILAGLVLVAINPARQFAQARNTERTSHVNAILNAIGQRSADNKGVFEVDCDAGTIPTSATAIGSGNTQYDIASCLVPTYMPSFPFDPSDADAHFTSEASYDTGYTIVRDATSGRVTIAAPSAEIGETVSVTR